jgi:branched-chain amino acid transport system substrate-binding protein
MTSHLRISVHCLAALVLTTALAACTKKEPVRLGFVGGITGRVADLGVAGRNGAMLAIEERNAAGGVNGRQIELVVRDDEQNPETAKRVVTELIRSKVEVIIGPMTSGMAMAVVPLVNASRTIMVSPTVTTSELTGKDDNFLRVISSTAEYGAKNARCEFERCGHRTVAAIYDLSNRSYTESWFNSFRSTYEGLGGRIVKTVTFTSGKDTGQT